MLNNKTLLKIVSVLIALGMWLVVVAGHEEMKEMTVPVKLINVPKDYIAMSDYTNVTITIKGAARLLQGLENSDVLLNIDVASFPEGHSIRKILPADFKTPLRMEVVDVKPNSLIVTIDKLASKEVRVLPSVIGDVDSGYKVENITLKPNTAVITGASSVVSHLENISTMQINLSDRSENFALNVSMKEYNGITKIEPDMVEVRVKLKEKLVEQDFNNVPVECMNLKSNLYVVNTPSLDFVKVRGREDVIDTFLDKVTFVTDCSHINSAGTYTGSVAYKTNLIVDILELTPQKINLEIKER